MQLTASTPEEYINNLPAERKPDDVPLDFIGRLASRLTPQEWINEYEKGLKR